MDSRSKNNRTDVIKRLFDIGLSTCAIFFLFPIMIFISILIYTIQGMPILFLQVRPGMRERPFRIYKFCTMTNRCDGKGCMLPDADRITIVGKFLRSTSLDELPELYNVLKGDMSIVGPRPLLMQYLDRYTPEQARRHEVKPGITGCAQINGRNAITWEEKFRLDVWYVDNWSVTLDLKIIAATIRKVLKREGISAEGEATMPVFMGSKQ